MKNNFVGESITSKNTFPEDVHYAVIEYDSVYIPGDERSRTNPGHGYPAEHRSIVNYRAFSTKEELEKWIKWANSSYGQRQFSVIQSTPLKITTSVSVEVKP